MLRRVPSMRRVISQACTAKQVLSPTYLAWAEALNDRPLTNRKQWEWHYILQGLTQSGVVRPGSRGLGFGVGTEPITPYLASKGCTIVATDLVEEEASSKGWVATGQHAQGLEQLNRNDICSLEQLERLVTFRHQDMRNIDPDLRGFDFTWSSCALEHLGDLEAGMTFVEEQMHCLRPGGVGVHTTEYNVYSNDDTLTEGHTVVYRRRDIEELVRRLRRQGHKIRATFYLGVTELDQHVDKPPFTDDHLRVEVEGHVVTSYGLLVKKGGRPA